MPAGVGYDARGMAGAGGNVAGGGVNMAGLFSNPALRQTLGKLLMQQADPQQPPLTGAANPQTGGGYNSVRSGAGDTQIPTGAPEEGMDYGAIAKKVAPSLADAVGDMGGEYEAPPRQGPVEIPSQVGIGVEGSYLPPPTSRSLGGGNEALSLASQVVSPEMAENVRRIKAQFGGQYSDQEILKFLQSQSY